MVSRKPGAIRVFYFKRVCNFVLAKKASSMAKTCPLSSGSTHKSSKKIQVVNNLDDCLLIT